MSSRKDRRSAYIITDPDEFAASFAAGYRTDASKLSSADEAPDTEAVSGADGADAEARSEGRTRRGESRTRNARDAARAAREAIKRSSGSADRFGSNRGSSSRSTSGTEKAGSAPSSGRSTEMGRLSVVGAIVLAALTVLSPWFFGSITPLYVFILLIGFAALVALWWTTVATQGGRAIQLPWNLVPLLLAVGFAAFQLVPLSESWLKTLAPDQYALREDLGLVPAVGEATDDTAAAEDAQATGDAAANAASATDVMGPIYESRDGLPLSMNPQRTRDYLVLLLIATTAFACAVVFLRRRRWFLAFATIVAVNGFLLSVFGIVQYFTGDGKLFWTYAVDRSTPFASFVNGNNAGGYLNLCLACLLGVALNAFRSSVHNRHLSLGNDSSDWPGSEDGDGNDKSFGASMLSWFADLTVWKLFLMLMIAIVMTGVFLTLSRGAIIANLVALGLTAMVMLLSQRHRAAGAGLIVVVILGGMLTYGLNEVQTVNQELKSLQEIEYENDIRWMLVRDLAPHWKSYLWTGAGLGSFQDLYRIHRADTNDKLFHHADNTYLEAYFETGLIGTSLLLILILWTFWQAIYLVRYGETTADNAIGVIAAFAIFSQFAQAFADFGLYVPANMILMATICGGTAIHAHRVAEARRASRSGASRPVRIAIPTAVAWLIPLALFGAMIWLVRPTQREVELSFAMDRARALLNVQDKSELDPAEVDEAIAQLRGIAAVTANGEAYRRLGDLNVVRFRLGMAPRLMENANRAGWDMKWGIAYPLTSMPAVHGLFIDSTTERAAESQMWTKNDPLVVEYLEPAFEAYRVSRQYAPFQALTYLRLAELSVLRDEPQLEEIAIKRAVMLSPGRAEIQVRAGVLKANRGEEAEALEHWKRSLALSEQYRLQILNDAAVLFSHEDIVTHLLPNDAASMTDLLARLKTRWNRFIRTNTGLANLLTRIRERAVSVYETAIAEDPASLSVEDYLAFSQVYEDLGQPDDAESVLRRAIDTYPKRTDHRFVLAEMLQRDGRFAEALDVVNDALFYNSDDPEYASLKKDLERQLKDQDASPNTPNSGEETNNDEGL